MRLIGILFNPRVPEATSLVADIAAWLKQREMNFWVEATENHVELQTCVAGSDLLVVLGGDGTTLMAARLAAPHKVPIFGVNLGRVGFLSESSPEHWQNKLEKVLAGEHWLESRLMLHAVVRRHDKDLADMVALNDVVVSRGSQVRVVRFHLYVDSYHVTTYTADGLITATPTGSTAYSMAAGGPLLPPELQNYLVLPVAPHLSFERPVVLHKEAIVKIQVETEHEAIATADGQAATLLQNGDEVIISKSHHESTFARIDGPSYFYHRLMQRLSYWSLKQ